MEESKSISSIWSKIGAYIALMRLDRPIGIYLLLWPTLIALWIAGAGKPDAIVVAVFLLGVVLMRSVGCVINDLVDKDFDGFVVRTNNRPLATGLLRQREAFILLICLIGASFLLVLTLNEPTQWMSGIALFLAILYPFTKRHTHFAQVFLGAAFGWAIPMAFVALRQDIPWQAFALYGAVLLWAVAYDTQYAMADREDDVKLGLKSTAILFGSADRLIIVLLQIIVLSVFIGLGFNLEMGTLYFIGPWSGFIFVAYQYQLTKNREPENCLRAFRNNHFLGVTLFIFLWLDYEYRSGAFYLGLFKGFLNTA